MILSTDGVNCRLQVTGCRLHVAGQDDYCQEKLLNLNTAFHQQQLVVVSLTLHYEHRKKLNILSSGIK